MTPFSDTVYVVPRFNALSGVKVAVLLLLLVVIVPVRPLSKVNVEEFKLVASIGSLKLTTIFVRFGDIFKALLAGETRVTVGAVVSVTVESVVTDNELLVVVLPAASKAMME